MAMANNGAYLKKNPRGIWEIRWSERGRSRRLSTRTGNLREAQTTLAGFLTEADRDDGRAPQSVDNVLDHYYRQHVVPNVVDKDRQTTIIRWLKQDIGQLDVLELTSERVLAYADKRRRGVVGPIGRKVTDSTIRRELNCLQSAFSYAVKTRLILSTDSPHIPMPSESEPRDFWLTEDEMDALLTQAREDSLAAGEVTRAHRFVLIAYYTAARAGVITALRWDWIDFDRDLIRFDKAKRQTKKRSVSVPMTGRLKTWLEQAKREADTDLVMGDTTSIRRALEALCRRTARETGNERFLQVHPHALRHTSATHMMRAGVDPWQVAGMLGDTLATVIRVYAKHAPDHLRAAADALR